MRKNKSGDANIENPQARVLKFVCPQCGGDRFHREVHVIEAITGVSYDGTVEVGSAYTSIPEVNAPYRCADCDEQLTDESGQPIKDEASLADWLLRNCEQPEQGLAEYGGLRDGFRYRNTMSVRLIRDSFRRVFHESEKAWNLERWEHRDGAYRLMVSWQNSLYVTDTVSDPVWKGIVKKAFKGVAAPEWAFMQDLFHLVIFDSDGEVIDKDVLEAEEVPHTRDEWDQVVKAWLTNPDSERGSTLALVDYRTNKTIFSHRLR